MVNFEQRYLKREQAAKYAGVTSRTLDKWFSMGLRRVKTPTGGVRIDRVKLDQFMREHEELASS